MSMFFKLLLQRLKPIWYPRQQHIHLLQVLVRVEIFDIKGELDTRVNDAFKMVDHFSISLILSESRYDGREFLMDGDEEVFFPLNEGEL